MNHFLALITLTATLHAASPVVEVVSLGIVKVDGLDIGNVSLAIRNRPEFAATIQAQLQAREAALEAKIVAAAARRAELIALAKSRLATLTPEARAVVVGVITAAEKPDRDLMREKLAAELAAQKDAMAAKQKELDAIK